MEEEILETVVKELLKEQKRSNQLLEELIAKEKVIGEKVGGFDDRLKQLRIVVPPVDTLPVVNLMGGFFERIKQVLESQPKNVIHQRRYLLFPEDNTGYYYKIIFGRLIPWGIVFLACVYCFSLGKDYIEKANEATTRRYYYETYQSAWTRLDSTIGSAGRKKMEEAMQKAVGQH